MPSHGFEFDFVISYAGEDEQFAKRLRKALGAIRVFYAPEYQADIWGKNLFEYLAEIYNKKGRYCVLLVSQHYVAKKWTQHEWRNAQERVLRTSDTEYILPIRLDDSELLGLPATIAYLDARRLGVGMIAKLALAKLEASNARRGIETFRDSRQSPVNIMEKFDRLSTDRRINEIHIDLALMVGSRHIFGGSYSAIVLSKLTEAFDDLPEPGIVAIDFRNVTGFLDSSALAPLVLLAGQRSRNLRKTLLCINTTQSHRDYLAESANTAEIRLEMADVFAPRNTPILLLARAVEPDPQWHLIGENALTNNQKVIWSILREKDAVTMAEIATFSSLSIDQVSFELQTFFDHYLVDKSHADDQNAKLHPIHFLLTQN